MADCPNNFLKLYKGYPSEFADVDWLSISFDSVISLTNYTMDVKLGSTTKHFTDLTTASIINYTATETGALSLGMNNLSIIVTDTNSNSRPFSTSIPVMVTQWVQGDQKLDTYDMSVDVTLDNETLFTINIETAKVSQEWVEELISTHNTSEQAHQFIQQNLTIEATARSSADTTLQANINSEATARQNADNTLAASINTEASTRSAADTVLTNNLNTEIATRENADGVLSTAISTEATTRANADTNLQTQINGKQATISDLATIRSGATLGATSLQPSDVINDVQHTDTNKPLSANMGKELQDQITNLKQRGRYLSVWNCETGFAETEPTVNPYTYKAGDYFIVGVVATGGADNYRPVGSSYDKDVPSRTVETADVKVNDTYYYDGSSWTLLSTEQPTVAFNTLAGDPYDNSNLAAALNTKQANITSTAKLSSDLVDDTNHTNKFVTDADKTNWNSKVSATYSSANEEITFA